MAVGSIARSAPVVTGILVALLLAAARPAAGCTINCTGTQCTCSVTGTCNLTTQKQVGPGSVIDCPNTDITLTNGNGIEGTDGFFTLKARDLTINSGAVLKAGRATPGAAFGMVIQLTDDLTLHGFINANGNGMSSNGDGSGGSVSIETDGDVIISPAAGGDKGISANGQLPRARGGSVHIFSKATVTIDDAILAKAAENGPAAGGSVDVTAVGDIFARGTIVTLGRQSQAGNISLSAGGTIDVENSLLAEGWGNDGDGGNIHIEARTVTIDESMSAQGGRGVTGGSSAGGAIVVDAGDGGVNVASNVDLNATSGDQGAGFEGGAIVIRSDDESDVTINDGDITLSNGVRLLTRSEHNGGDGGDVVIASGGDLTLGSVTIDARGNTTGGSQGAGATVSLKGCTVAVAANSSIDATGWQGGTVMVTAAEVLTMTSPATVNASGSGEQGEILLAYRSTGKCTSHPALACILSKCDSGSCTHSSSVSCVTDLECTGCPSGTCALGNPVVTGVTFSPSLPAPPEGPGTEEHNLDTCR